MEFWRSEFSQKSIPLLYMLIFHSFLSRLPKYNSGLVASVCDKFVRLLHSAANRWQSFFWTECSISLCPALPPVQLCGRDFHSFSIKCKHTTGKNRKILTSRQPIFGAVSFECTLATERPNKNSNYGFPIYRSG